MSLKKQYDVIIIGGSFAGLSAAMALGRSRRHVLIIDNNQPCNRQTPHSHNLITHDGETPASIKAKALEQVLAYNTVALLENTAVKTEKTPAGFVIGTADNQEFASAKLIFASGVKDELPPIPGLQECWGITLIHCPYCHGYEVSDKRLGAIANGDIAYHLAGLLPNWSTNLTIFTNGAVTLSEEQLAKLKEHNIPIIETPVRSLIHQQGVLSAIELSDGKRVDLDAVFIRPSSTQHSPLPAALGCEIKDGLIVVDELQRTTVPGIYAAGDNSTRFRALSMAIAAGTKAGAGVNWEILEERF
ncbi:Thioredoxin reductase [Chitinophaga terrae (ex Kim and Jung 2007)]|uniref:Thioredoxin reductase n=1 Tax=Chitinophaga terrae (ex Kim and Jung 2007) TaxID=408074 RepID=A0A1H4ASE8_9BACT|nr:NAD(P)/FAD-dependent oxidoreductase [Chitinophaga terrae (ex Kim and Jung 2007)]GEP89164.1 hypothetical protein CTE07_08090 [Chitinophaga terrae (ex Kim and Jung 2007)]SEA38833.1 Thioredoxin reductase [Chitinophaga terrae (ex Kim and Jung 2007)]